jgi:HSP20 family molecular chaperone IbpA
MSAASVKTSLGAPNWRTEISAVSATSLCISRPAAMVRHLQHNQMESDCRTKGIHMIGESNVIEVKHCDTPGRMKEVMLEELRRDFEEWTTNRDELLRPRIELTKEGDEYAARVVLPGVDPTRIEVMVAEDAMLVKGETANHRRLMAVVVFPQLVDSTKVHAAMNNGLLSIRVKIAHGAKIPAFGPKARESMAGAECRLKIAPAS